MASLKEEWSCYGGGVLWRNGHVTEVSITEGKWSCYGGGKFNGGRMVILQRWPVMEGACACYLGGQFNGGRMVMLHRWSL